jgi:hypothetical protein
VRLRRDRRGNPIIGIRLAMIVVRAAVIAIPTTPVAIVGIALVRWSHG